jgi:NTE family protein
LRDGDRPTGLESALARKNDLIFSNQTWQRLAAFGREQDIRIKFAGGDQQDRRAVLMLYLSYRPLPEEAGPEREFDYSARMLERRGQAGALDMEAAIATLEGHASRREAGVVIKSIRRPQAAPEGAVRWQQSAS